MKKLLTLAASAALMVTFAFGQELKAKKPTISNDSEITSTPKNSRPIRGRVMDASPNDRQPLADHNNGKRMTFQGSLFQNGEAFDGTADLSFTIEFDSAYSWEETHESVTVINGLYSVTLGQFNPMPRGLFFFQDEREMQVEVNGTVLGRVKLYAPFETRSDRDNFVLLFDQEGVPKAEMSVWGGQGFLNVDGPDDRSNAILSGNFYNMEFDSTALNHGMLALYGPSNDPSEPDHLRVEVSSRGDGTANGAHPFMNMYAVNQNSNELEPMVELYVPNFTDSTGASTFKTGRLNFYDTDGGLGQLRNNNLLFWNPQGNLPGWFGTLGRNRGFSQLLSYDDDGNYTGGLLTGWFYDGLPHVYLEDGNESMGAHLHMPEGAGELVLNGPGWNPNFAVGPKNWENGNLPYLRMNGQDEVSFVNDNGTPDDETDDFEDFYIPDLIWMEVQKWEDGTEIGSLMLRGTDGSEFGINSHGIDAQRTKVQEYELREEFGHRTVGNWRSFDTGGQLNIGGIINDTDTTETYGGGVSIGSKFWQGTPQHGYLHVRGPVNNDNYFGANIRFEIEAVQDQHDNTSSEFRMYSPMLDENSQARQVLNMSTVSNDGANYAGQFSIEGSSSPNFAIGAKTWETDIDGSNLPYMRLNGATPISSINDNGTPDDESDDFEDIYHPDLIWIEASRWQDGTEFGTFRSNSAGNPNHAELTAYGVAVNDENHFANLASTHLEFNGTAGQFANMGIGIDDGSPNTNNGGALNLGGISGTTGVRLYGEFVAGDGTSVSHMAFDDNSGSHIFLWGNGDIDATGNISASSVSETSDKRFKKEVKSIDGALAKVQQLNGYTYFWNRTAKKAKGIQDESQQIGVLAQEVEEIFPQMVKTDAEGYKSVNYSALSAVLIEAVKELNAEIAVLKAENKDLKASVEKNAALEERLAKIESLLGVKSGKSSNAHNK